MIGFVFTTLWQGFLPLLLLSFVVSYWYIIKFLPNHNSTSTTELKDKIQQHSHRLHNEKDENSTESLQYAFGALPNKWVAFGGNYYGLVALYTFLII